MRHRWGIGWVAAAALGLLLVSERPVHAYIDPGSGSMIYQALLAGLLGLGFTLRRTTDTISRLVRRFTGRGGADSTKADRA